MLSAGQHTSEQEVQDIEVSRHWAVKSTAVMCMAVKCREARGKGVQHSAVIRSAVKYFRMKQSEPEFCVIIWQKNALTHKTVF